MCAFVFSFEVRGYFVTILEPSIAQCIIFVLAYIFVLVSLPPEETEETSATRAPLATWPAFVVFYLRRRSSSSSSSSSSS